ncbi:hypothetical protein FHG87_005046, partial [Trinorchestia longiramus]
LAVPFINEEFGVSYSLEVDENNHTMKGMFEGILFSRTYLFEANAAATSNLVELEVVTPIEGYRRILGRGEIDAQRKHVNAEMIVGKYEAKFEVRLSFKQPVVEIKTPFKILEHFKLSYDYTNA